MFETWKVLRQTRIEHWIDALYWLGFSSIGGLVPLWGLWFVLPAINQPVTLATFSQNGEFALYGASFASASLYIIFKEKPKWLKKLLNQGGKPNSQENENKDFPAKMLYLLGYVSILGATMLLFALVTLVHIPDSNLPLNIKFLSFTTLVVFVVSIVMSYVTTVVDNYLTTYDPEKEMRISRRQELEDVNSDFDSLKDK
jgi:hypothetical protein